MAIDKIVSFKNADLLALEQVHVMIQRYRRAPNTGYLVEIGKMLHSISWNEDDSGCIRNKHGYRNRAKNGSNKINASGASIDFETLGHLRRLATDPNFAPIIQHYNAAILSSLDQLERKIWHVVCDESQFIDQHDPTLFPGRDDAPHLSENYRTNCGLLWYYSAYYHDAYCISTILDYLDSFNIVQDNDLSVMENRYHLAYIFCQIGELAKEVSDFVKVERVPAAAEQNVIRFFFTKLGHYRQRIKNQPYIVHNGPMFFLIQMRTALAAILPDLRAVLLDLRERLHQFGLSRIEIYCSIVDFHDQVYPLSFEKTHSTLLPRITNIMRLGTKKKLRSTPQKLNDNIIRLKVEIASIESEIEKSQHVVKVAPAKAEPIERKAPQHNKYSQQLLAVLSQDICRQYFDYTFSEVITFCGGLKGKIDDSFSEEQQVIVKKLRALCILYSDCERLIRSLNIEVENLGDLTLADVHNMLAPATASQDTGNLTAALAHKLSVRRKMLLEEQRLYSEATDFLDSVQSRCKKEHRAYSVTASEVESAISNLVDVLSYLSSAADTLKGLGKVNYDILMAIGLIGQYSRTLFELTKNLLIRKHINALLEECMKRADYLRSKMIFHDSTNQDPKVIITTLDEMILPIRKDFEALEIVLHPRDVDAIQIVRAFMRLGLETEALSLLYEHLEEVEKKSTAAPKNFAALASALEGNSEFPVHASHMRSLSQYLPEEAQQALAVEAVYLVDKINILLHMLDCYTKQQNFTKALDISHQLMTILTGIIGKLKAGQAIVQTDLTNRVLHEMEEMYLYTVAQQSYLYLNIGNHQASMAAMTTIARVFAVDISKARRHGSMVARFFTDLCHAYYNDPPLAGRYLAIVDDILSYCPDRLIVEFNVHFRRYELALSNFQSVTEVVTNLSKYFYDHETIFKRDYGIHYCFYKMEVLLAEYNMYSLQNDRSRMRSTMEDLDSIQAHVSDLVLKNKYFFSKLLMLSLSQDTEAFLQTLNLFFNLNRDTNNHRKFISSALRVLKTIRIHDRRSANCCATFLLKHCDAHLDEREKTLLNKIIESISILQQRFVGNSVPEASIEPNDPSCSSSSKKFGSANIF